MTKDEAHQQYKEALAKIDQQASEAREVARITLRNQLKTLREMCHEELKGLRAIEQETKRSRR